MTHAPTDEPSPRAARVATQFRAATELPLPLPLPGSGRTAERWAALTALAQQDLCVARLCEAHLDALAILAELAGPVPSPGSRWGVWAAHPPSPGLTARSTTQGWRLTGTKPWCSGARLCTHALVTADAPDGYRLFAVEVGAGTVPRAGSWQAVGMAASETLAVDFEDVAAEPVGGRGAYLDRPGFWHGALGVAACWRGGAIGVAGALLGARLDAHGLAHLGAVDVALTSLAGDLDRAAREVDADPSDRKGTAELTACRVRARTEQVAVEVLERVGRALGAGPLGHDARHAALVADLPVYLRQSHAERDLAHLGELVQRAGAEW